MADKDGNGQGRFNVLPRADGYSSSEIYHALIYES